MTGSSADPRQGRSTRNGGLAWLSRPRQLSPLLTTLPGAARRRRLLLAWLLALASWLLRPWPPFLWMPGWCVGGLLLWAVAELLLWLWRPQRSA